MTSQMPPRAVSTWSLHRTLGGFIADDSAFGGGPFMPPSAQAESGALLKLIPQLKANGYSVIQICHFHLESRDDTYLQTVRAALEEHEIELDALLIDDGDLSAPDIQPHLDWYDSWLEVARKLGAKRARLCAGRNQPTPELLRRSGELLAQLASRHPDVRIVTENWMEMIPDADAMHTVLDAAGEDVGLLIDLANWHKPEKYDQLKRIAGRAETCHAKCVFHENGPDEEDFRKTLGILKDAAFTGPLALIYDGPDSNEWSALETEWRIVESVFR